MRGQRGLSSVLRHHAGTQSRAVAPRSPNLVPLGSQSPQPWSRRPQATRQGRIGDLDKITRIVTLFGMVNSTPRFDQQPAVINGTWEVLIEVFGDRADRQLPRGAGAGASRAILLDRETHIGD